MRRLAQDTFVLLAERALRLGAGLLVAIYCARRLGPENYGLYTYAVSLMVLFSCLGQAGLEPILVRELVRRTDAPAAVLKTAGLLRMVGAISAAILALATATTTSSPELPATTLVLLLAIAGLLQPAHVFDAWLQSRQAFRASSTAKSLALVCAAVARLAAVNSSQPLLALASVTIGEAALTGLLLWGAARRNGLQPVQLTSAPPRDDLKHLWTLARPMLLSSVAITIYARADVFLLGQLSTRGEVGEYSAATSLSEAFYLVPVALITAATPRLIALHGADEAAFKRVSASLMRYCSIAGLVVAIAISLGASRLVVLVYGNEFARTPEMLAIHVWSTWMVFVSTASEPWYINRGLQRFYLRKTVIGAAANLALNFCLIPSFGGAGAAAATVVSYALSAVICNLLWPETRDLFFVQLRAMLALPPR